MPLVQVCEIISRLPDKTTSIGLCCSIKKRYNSPCVCYWERVILTQAQATSATGRGSKMQNNTQLQFFECQRCGKCCTEIGLPYDSRQIEEIAQFLGLTVDKVIERYYGRFSDDHRCWISENHKRTPCPFIMTISSGKACAIYPVRPNACRRFPFETDFDSAKIICPALKTALKKHQEEQSWCYCCSQVYMVAGSWW